MEIQLTDFENAAYAIFIVLLTRAILSYGLNFYIPISKVLSPLPSFLQSIGFLHLNNYRVSIPEKDLGYGADGENSGGRKHAYSACQGCRPF